MRPRERTAAEDCLPLDVRGLVRDGLVAPARHVRGNLTWTWGDDVLAVAEIESDTTRGTAGWVRVSGEIGGARIVQRIRLDARAEPLGGVSWWFLCPVTGARHAKLYLPSGTREFASIPALGLIYESQRLSKLSRAIARVHKVRGRIGGDECASIPRRPKWSKRPACRLLEARSRARKRVDIGGARCPELLMVERDGIARVKTSSGCCKATIPAA